MEHSFMKINKKPSKSDEWATPPEAVEPLVPFIDKNKVVWCPFDTEDSNYVKVLRNHGISVVFSHISQGKDFFEYEPKTYDYIISNPPFSNRQKILKRLYELGKPFAMLMNNNGLFDNSARYKLFQENGVQLLVIHGRTAFTNLVTGQTGTPAFQSLYVCHNFLPNDIVFDK